MNTSKIIKGVVNNGRYTVTAPIVKEDYGLYLQIEGVELPETYQVDFSNSENSGTSVTMIGNADGVLIPRQFIDSGKDVFAFLYHVGEDFGRTVYKFRIPNKVRPDRTNEQPTPEEQLVIDQAISALNSAVAQTAQDVIDADASAQSASADADRAEEARTDAQNYATQAEQSAINADLSATNASASASASAQSASNAETARQATTSLVAEAQGYADASEQGAMASANSAEQAHQFAQTASLEAESAQDYATQADISANTASNKASEASTSAQTASQKATESAQSASQALGYKTDAESAKTASQTAQGLAEGAMDSAVSAKTDAESAKADAESARDEAQQAVASISDALADKADIITDTASGSIASFSDGADNLPLKSLVIDINPIQDLSNGDPSPENICPISGWTQVGVEQRGVNVWDEETELGLLNSDGSVGSSTSRLVTKNYIPVSPNTTYCMSISISDRGRGAFYDAEQQLISYYSDFPKTGMESVFPNNGSIVANNGRYYFLFVTPSNARYMKYNFGAVFGTTYNHDISINYPSTATPYEPYTGRSITIDLGQTVYGGKLDVLTGVLTVDRAYTLLNNPDKWIETSGTADFRYGVEINDRKLYDDSYSGLTCSYVPCAYGAEPYGRWNASAGYYFSIKSSTITLAQVKADASAGNIAIAYAIAQPITIQLTPNQVNSLLGVNNIWADSGDTEAEYRADTKLYISKKIAEAISALS